MLYALLIVTALLAAWLLHRSVTRSRRHRRGDTEANMLDLYSLPGLLKK